MYMIEQIYQCLENCKEVRAVFLDISKAFDRVWHEGRISKLKYVGVRGLLLKWLQSYLSGRQERVVLEGAHSEWQNITAGVPQGRVLGPLLFLGYNNDMVIWIEAFLYADDSMLLDTVESSIEPAIKLNTYLVSMAPGRINGTW